MTETLLALPLLIVMAGGLLLTLYFLISLLWSEHWVYRANMCLVEGNSPWQCKTNLEKKLQVVLSPSLYQISEIWRTPRHSRVKIYLQLPVTISKTITKLVQSDLELPLASRNIRIKEASL